MWLGLANKATDGDEPPAETLYQFITRDFESASGSMALQPQPLSGGGNFMFARQAMMLLEWAARVCRADTTGGPATSNRTPALGRLSQELARIERRYFTELPAAFPVRVSEREFTLPSVGPNPDRELLVLLFDLIRNGQAHQYQQINVDLADRKELQIALTGVSPGLHLGTSPARPADHLQQLRFLHDVPESVCLYPSPAYLEATVPLDHERERPFTRRLCLGTPQNRTSLLRASCP